ncbi:hypothetical protein KY290_012946 [Solanum tuberosum]|uniref:Uncharacterized protein n=1 Tax=Solanum tuberosum TaxID=4113 RepID=A0ABQ7VL12_SOLTU|nr:hypothetical protein KY290_012946 [Solanum tuberosum]
MRNQKQNYLLHSHKKLKNKRRRNVSGIPKYAKYVKDVVANNSRLAKYATVALTEEYSSRIQNRLLIKLKDPGSFTV